MGDCDSTRDWCSVSTERCTRCNGTLVGPNSTFNASVGATQVKSDTEKGATIEQHGGSDSSWPFLLAGETPPAAGSCCYTGPKDCDGSRDWCSASAARCAKCGGNFSNATANAMTEADQLASGTMLAAGSWEQWMPKQHRGDESSWNSHSQNNSNWEQYVPKQYRKQAKEEEKREKEQQAAEEKQEKEEEARENGGNTTAN